MTDDLVAFLKARLDEDERAARAAVAGPWFASPALPAINNEYTIGSDPDDPRGSDIVYQGHVDGGVSGEANANHIARHDPARALAEVDAKRRILGWADSPALPEYERLYVLDALALPYRDHPDYRSEWAPEA